MTVKYGITLECDRCGDIVEYHGESQDEMPAKHRVLPDEWGRISGLQYENIDLCLDCQLAFKKFVDVERAK